MLHSISKDGSAADNQASSKAEPGAVETAAVLNPDLEDVMVSAKTYF